MAGLAAPIVLWQLKKGEFPALDQHGRVVANWLATELVLLVVSSLLCFFVVGFLPLIILLLLGVIFPIIGAVKASRGELWTYTLSILKSLRFNNYPWIFSSKPLDFSENIVIIQ